MLAPFGRLVKNFKDTKFSQMMQQGAMTLGQNIQKDKLGFMLVAYNTGWDVFYWYHATTLTGVQQFGNIFFSVVTAVVFGTNKDMWSKTTRPITDKIKSYFANSPNWSRNSFQEMATRFASSLVFATAISLVRVPLISPDNLLDVGLKLSHLTYPLLLSFISTFASFSWNEEIARIDEKKFPNSKFVARSLLNIKSVVLGTLASTAALLNPDVYGIHPWVVLVSTGAAGLLFYLKFERLYPYLEAKGANLQQRWKDFKESRLSPSPVQCSALL